MSDNEEDFATMFEASEKARRFERGQTVDGMVVAIGPEVAFVSLGAKSDAEIDLAELKNADGALEVAVGDRIQAKIVSTSGGIVLSRRGVRNAATQRELEDAFSAGMAVEGKVENVVKGGYEVRIARERAFCPLSQIDIMRTADPAVHEGKTYSFRILEYRDGGQDARRVRGGNSSKKNSVRSPTRLVSRLVPGACSPAASYQCSTTVRSSSWAGPIQGLLHVSDMSWSRVPSAHAVAAVGDEITVKVLRVDEATGKISLGSKQLLDDPWSTAAARFEVGQVCTGRVTRIAEFGAFVELEPGIEGLIARVDIRAHRSASWLGQRRATRHDGDVRNREHRHPAEAHRPVARRRGLLTKCRYRLYQPRAEIRSDCRRQGRTTREVWRVRVLVAGAHRPDPACRDRPRS